jgi:hypothetical protein
MNGPPVPREAAHHPDEGNTATGHGFRITECGWLPRNAAVNARMVGAMEGRSRRAPDDELARVTDDIRRLLAWDVVDIDGITPITDPDRIELIRLGRAIARVRLSNIDPKSRDGLLGRLEHAARTACSSGVADEVSRMVTAARRVRR